MVEDERLERDCYLDHIGRSIEKVVVRVVSISGELGEDSNGNDQYFSGAPTEIMDKFGITREELEGEIREALRREDFTIKSSLELEM